MLAAVDPFDIVALDWARARSGTNKVSVTPIHPDVFYDSLGRYHSLQEDVSDGDGMFTPIAVNWTKDDLERADLTHMISRRRSITSCTQVLSSARQICISSRQAMG